MQSAFLEPEILIIDEVLAVGDFDFQKKAIGKKMKEVSSNGDRTVLFVSHTMSSVKALCSRAILLENGNLIYNGSVDDAINKYLNVRQQQGFDGIIKKSDHTYKSKNLLISYVNTVDNNMNQFQYLENIQIKICYEVFSIVENAMIDLRFHSPQGIEIAHATHRYDLQNFIELKN